MKISIMVVAMAFAGCAPNMAKPNVGQVFFGSTKCQDGNLFKAIERYPHWMKIGTCRRYNKTGSIFN